MNFILPVTAICLSGVQQFPRSNESMNKKWLSRTQASDRLSFFFCLLRRENKPKHHIDIIDIFLLEEKEKFKFVFFIL